MKFRFIFIGLFLLINFNLLAQDKKTIFFPGEEIEYRVSFMGINLGTIKITSKDYVDYEGKKIPSALAEMRSAQGIPFVDLHAFFESWFSTGINYSEKFNSKVKQSENSWTYEYYNVDNNKKQVTYEQYLDKDLLIKTEHKFDNRVLDGLALFFFARQFTDIKRTVKVPTLMNNSISNTNLNFHGKKESAKINAVDYPVRCLYFDGRADWEGIYGLKGYFQGWFSDDDARVPIRALMNVYVGNIDIQLVKWKRGDWQPPRGK
jgi:hypothetical protein